MAAELNIEAERREFEAAWRAKHCMPDAVPFARWADGSYEAHSIDDGFEGWCMARRADPSSSSDELPPLPKPKAPATEYFSDEPVYSVEEVRAILAADRRARQGEPVAWACALGLDFEPMEKPDVDWGAECTWHPDYKPFPLYRAAIQAATPADAPTTAKNAAVRFDGEDAREQQPMPPDELLLRIAAEQDYGDEDPKCILRLLRAAISTVNRVTPEMWMQLGASQERLRASSERVGALKAKYGIDSCRATGTDRAQAQEK